jgi:hypothetical protein
MALSMRRWPQRMADRGFEKRDGRVVRYQRIGLRARTTQPIRCSSSGSNRRGHRQSGGTDRDAIHDVAVLVIQGPDRCGFVAPQRAKLIVLGSLSGAT